MLIFTISLIHSSMICPCFYFSLVQITILNYICDFTACDFCYAQVTLPGEGRDRVFKVTMKWLAQVNLYTLEEALEGRTRTIPYDAIQVPYLYKAK